MTLNKLRSTDNIYFSIEDLLEYFIKNNILDRKSISNVCDGDTLLQIYKEG